MQAAFFALRLNEDLDPHSELAPRLRRALPFEPHTEAHHRFDRSMLWGFFPRASGWAPALIAETAAGLAVVSGYGLADDEPLTAEAALGAADLAPLWRRYRGEWSLCRITKEGLDLACSDLGTEPVYLVEHPRFTAASNRARLLWEALRAFGATPEADLGAMAPLLSLGYPACTDRTAVRGVRVLDRTRALTIPRSGGVVAQPLDRARPSEAGPPLSWDELAERFRANVAWLSKVEQPIVAALTGGRDSRLVLAALLRSGLTERVDFHLSVPPEHADGLVATALAERFNLRFTRKEPLGRRELLADIQRHVLLTEGALGAWDLTKAFTFSPELSLHGVFGELYRGRPQRFNDVARSARAIAAGPMDFTRILRPSTMDLHRERVLAWAQRTHDEGARADELIDLFEAWEHMPHWAGQARLASRHAASVVNPVYHPDLFAAYRGLSNADRVGERLHFELTVRLSPELAELPFAQVPWSRRMVAQSSRPETRVAAHAVQHRAAVFGPGWQLPAIVGAWRAIRERIAAALPSLAEIVVPSRVDAMLDVAALLFDVEPAAPRRARVALRNPLLLALAKKRKVSVLRQILGLLTLAELLDALRRDDTPVMRVA